MSQENVEIVRQPIVVEAHPHRRLQERLFLRFPHGLVALTRATCRLSPRSRLRQMLLRRAVTVGFEATNRRDYETPFAFYHPEGELITPPQLVGLGFEPLYRGREDRIGFQRRWIDEWGEFRFEPEEIIDLGDRVLLIGRITGSGLSSRVLVDSEWANLLTVSAGQVVGEQIFVEHGEALEAAGLSE